MSTDTVRYWSDFNRVFYHPRSVVQINDYELGSSLMPFENFDSGEELFANIDREEDLLDRDFRPWAEECDQMQGIQIWTSGDDAWGGFASRYAERLRDEFGKISLWAWSSEEEKGKGQRATQLRKLTNAAKALAQMSMHASMYVPMSIPSRLPQSVQLDHDSQWHTSAMLATTLETMTLPSRLRSGYSKRGSLRDMVAALNVNGNQRVGQLCCDILDHKTTMNQSPQRRGAGDNRAPSSLQRHVRDDVMEPETNVSLDIDLSGSRFVSSSMADSDNHARHVFGAVDCVRSQATAHTSDEGATGNEDDLGYARKKARFSEGPIIERYQISLPYPMPDSFPHIFPRHTLQESMGVHTSLATTVQMATQVRALLSVVQRSTVSDERETLSNSLAEIAEAYDEGWDGGDDSDDD